MKLPPQSEKSFQSQVVKLAKLLGFKVYHTHDSRRSEPGFPDLVMVREGDKRVIYAELKTDRGKVTAEQAAWLTALAEAGEEVYVFRPCLWATVEKVLRHRGEMAFFRPGRVEKGGQL